MPMNLGLGAVLLMVLGLGVGRAAAAPFLGDWPRFIVERWDTSDGLPQSSVLSIVQAQDGYLWLGTLNGLVRFDGDRFSVFDESNVPGLTSSRIVQLFEDREGNLWIGTETGGIALLQGDRIIATGIGQHAAERRLRSAAQDDQGAVWLYTADGQLWRYLEGRYTPFLFGNDWPSACRCVIAEPNGPVWIGTDTRLAALSAEPDSGLVEPRLDHDIALERLDFLLASRRAGYWRLADGRIQKWIGDRLERDFGRYPWSVASVTAACEDREGNLVVGTAGLGVYWFDAEGKYIWLNSEKMNLSQDVILSLCVDREGALWVGTDGGGLNRVKRQVFEVLPESREPRRQVVQTTCFDAQGGLWVGSNGGGLLYWRAGVARVYGPQSGLTNVHVRAVWVDRNQAVWAGTWNGGLFRLEDGRFEKVGTPEFNPPVVMAIHEDRVGRLWFGTQSGLGCRDARGWRLYTTRDGLSADAVRAIADAPGDVLWIGTIGGGLNRLEQGRFTVFRQSDGLPSEDVSSLHLDREGVLWIGTYGRGLARWHEGRWTYYGTREGLASNSIGYLLEDDHGYLWIGSNRGLMRLRKQDLNALARGASTYVPCRVYGEGAGLPTPECTFGSQPAASQGPDGTLWFPTIRGLAAVHPLRLSPNPYPPPVLIENAFIDGQPQETNPLRTALTEALVIPPGRQRLEIHYTSLNLGAPDKVRFKYRLEGYETDWTEAGNTRVARYSRLPPGSYRFQVQACNEDGVWNETGSTLALTVLIPFWRNWWFLSGTGVFLFGSVAALIYYLSTQRLQRQLAQIRQAEALERERSRIAQDIHDQLGANLTQVTLLTELIESDKDNPGEVEGHARQISQTARETTRVLDEIVWAVNPANDTLDSLVSYVCRHAQDYLSVAGLRYRFDVPAQLPSQAIPPDVRHNLFLAFKEAVTNIVRHAQASEAWISLRLDPGSFTLKIQDNGRGLTGVDERVARSRNGLRNMRRRMEAIQGHFEIGPAPEGGTCVCLETPLSPAVDSSRSHRRDADARPRRSQRGSQTPVAGRARAT